MAVKNIHDADALLLYRVGPVYCCSPTMPVVSVQLPPRLSHPPGSNTSQPGVFRFASGIVRVVDLRQCFGVDEEDREHPGKIVVTEVSGGLAGFWVDEIIDVIHCPQQGWGSVPALVPRDIFTRTLLIDGHIQLYAEIENFNNFSETGYLRRHIQVLKSRLEANRPETAVTREAVAAPKNSGLQTPTELFADKPVSPESATEGGHPDADVSPSVDERVERSSLSGRESSTAVPQPSPARSLPPTPGKTPATTTLDHPSSAKPATRQVAAQSPRQVKVPAQSVSSGAISPPLNIAGKKSSTSIAAPTRTTVLPNPDSLQPPPAPTQTTATRQSDVDYGLWGLLGVLLVVVLAGGYFITDITGQAPVHPGVALPSADRVEFAESPEPRPDVDAVQQQAEVLVEEASTVMVREAPAEMPVDTGGSKSGAEASPDANADVEHVNSQQSYHASINEDDEGLVIVLDVPDEESLTDSASIIDESRDMVTSSQSSPTQLAEEVAVMEKDENAQTPTPPVARAEKKVVSTTVIHVVVKGDTLWHIARRYIHNPWRYPELARLSKIKNPDLIYPGDRVKIIINTKSRSPKE